MINFICYLIVFVYVVITSNFNVFLISYVGANILFIVGWFSLFVLNKRKFKQVGEKQKLDISWLTLLIFMIVAGFFDRVRVSNLVFGYAYLIYCGYSIVLCIKRRDYAFRELKIKYTKLFDIYSLIYLAVLLINISSYQL
jgi:hypothetical protein